VKNDSSNTRQALWLGLSGFSSIALAFVSSAILSRYFAKEEYGTYKQILYVYVTLQTVFTIGLPSVFSYFIPRYNKEEGKFFVNKLNLIFLVLGLIFSIVLYLSSDYIGQILKNQQLSIGLKIFSVFPLFTIPALGVEGLYVAIKKTKYIAIYNTINKLLMLVCTLIPVLFFNGGYKSAIIGWGIASFFIFCFAMYLKSKPYFGITKQKISNFYSTIFSYSTPLMLASLVGFLLASSNQFFISRYYGIEKFAEFANGFISLPLVGLVGGSIKTVLVPLFSKAHNENKLTEALGSYKSAVFKAVVLIFPLILFCIVFANDIVVFVYGDLYLNSAVYFQASLINDMFQVLPYVSVLLATGHSKIYFRSHLVSVIFLLPISYVISNNSFEPIAIVYVFVIIEIIRGAYLFFFLFKKEQINLIPFAVIKKIVLIVLHNLIVLFILSIFSNSILPNDMSLFIKITLNLFVFYALVLLTQNIIKIKYLDPILSLLKMK
jgi:O-antigen/teichoic acid export membrane protein